MKKKQLSFGSAEGSIWLLAMFKELSNPEFELITPTPGIGFCKR